MYRLDPATDLSFLLGKPLEQVARGLYQLQLNFFGETSIAIETSTEHRSSGSGLVSRWSPGSRAEFPIYDLLHTEIDEVEILARSALRLRFTNADDVFIVPEDVPYEAYQLMGPSIYIVV
jgi:Family of unknown function (DUF6188)